MDKKKSKVQRTSRVKKYPFNAKNKDVYTPTEFEINAIRWQIPKWTHDNPQYHIIEDILINDCNFTSARITNFTFSEIADILSRKTRRFFRKLCDRHRNLVKNAGHVTVRGRQNEKQTTKGRNHITLTDQQFTILCQLQDSPTTLLPVELESATKISRRTIGKILKVLREKGFTHQPGGSRKGEALTDKGYEFLSKKTQASTLPT